MKDKAISRNHKDKDDKLILLLEGLLEPEDEDVLWDHIEKCSSCRIKTNEITKFLRDIEKKGQMPYDNVKELITQRERTAALLTAIESLCRKPILKGFLKGVRDFLEKAFWFPLQEISPTFGEESDEAVEVVSPFAKVRYPLVFEWRPASDSRGFILKLEKREFKTTKNRIELKKDDLFLPSSREYEWELLIIDTSGNEKEGPVGYFTLCPQEEEDMLKVFEREVMGMNSADEMKLILIGSILEKKEFYIEAIEKYKKAYEFSSSADLTIRIATCYGELGLYRLREEWRKRQK